MAHSCWEGREGGSKCCVFHVRLQPSLGPGLCSFSSSCKVCSWLSSGSSLPFLPQILFVALNKQCVFPPNCEDFPTWEVPASLSPPGLTIFLTLLASEAGCAESSPGPLSRVPDRRIRGRGGLKALIGGVF